MRKHKLLFAIITGSVLAFSTTPFISQQSIKADSYLNAVTQSPKHLGFHKVLVIEPTYVGKIHWKYPIYKSTVGSKRKIPAGKIVKILRTGTNFGWYMKIPGHKGDYTIARKYNDSSWYDLPQKHVYMDYGLFNGAKKRVNKSYKFTWKQYCKLVKMGMYTLMNHPYGATHNKIMKQIKKWKLKAN